MNDDFIRAGFGEGFQQNFRPGAHQMNIKKELGQRSDRADDFGSEGYVRHEMSIHDIEVQPIGAGAISPFDFSAQTGVVGRQ